MTQPDELERQLADDLADLGQRFVDEEFSSELYRALANNVWRKEGAPGEVSLSWRRAGELVNDLRRHRDQPELVLAQTGGEGEISPVVADELARLGWNASALDSSRHQDAHRTQPESPPPADHGERHAPVADSDDGERRAHAEADQERLRRLGGVPTGTDEGGAA